MPVALLPTDIHAQAVALVAAWLKGLLVRGYSRPAAARRLLTAVKAL